MAVRRAAIAALGAVALWAAAGTAALGAQTPVAYGGAGGAGGAHGAPTRGVGVSGKVTGTRHRKTTSKNVFKNTGRGGNAGHGGRGGRSVAFNK